MTTINEFAAATLIAPQKEAAPISQQGENKMTNPMTEAETKSAHTPGQLSAFRSTIDPSIWYVGDEHFALFRSEMATEKTEAYAKLFSAAPDLLAALDGLLRHYVALVNSGDAGSWDAEAEVPVINARAAITRAESQ